eukprot:CAMPEP_0175936802 /NCGR_PEP_ID=MMETSP0108-20121206/21797_1 /TAXON_ID=195067 ORGANISM="Goniomonas pacifica, Strain CCMP1869" /NCGR_SAMPLE_ID=MMETSP0108 /ASSEMBLY_ACC=CAM_ASM_000204 /LENGTH=153 /DNA_ID=CAMNT_0017260891 /DNA_START=968 /DNA_END=1434 /DNA_ORIENTATION=+
MHIHKGLIKAGSSESERRARVAMPARHEMTQLAEAVEEDEDDVVPRATCLWVEIDSTPFFSVHQQGNPPGMAMAKKDGLASLVLDLPDRIQHSYLADNVLQQSMETEALNGDPMPSVGRRVRAGSIALQSHRVMSYIDSNLEVCTSRPRCFVL